MAGARAEHHDVVVIGAGQTGLATGHHLRQRGHDFVVLEANQRVGDTWRNRYDSLRLYSPAGADGLPGMPFPMPSRTFPTGRQMGDYLEAYAAGQELPVRTGTQVTRVETPQAGRGSAFSITTDRGEISADQVVVATGPFQRPRTPEFAAQLDPGIRQIHSADYRSPAQLREGPALVVGLSHSGADIAHEVALAGHPTIVSGRSHGELPFPIDSRPGKYLGWPIARFLTSNVLTLATPIGRRMAPRVRAGGGPLLRIRSSDLRAAGVELREGRTIGVQDGKPVLADGSVLDVANVIWCTGFQPDYSWIQPPLPTEQGFPVQNRGVIESVPGLYVLGVPFLFAFASMLVTGAGRDAAYVADQVAARAAEAVAA